MTIFLIIVPAIVFLVIAIALTWLYFQGRKTGGNAKSTDTSFRFRYVLSPVIILLITIILSAIFYNRVPEEVAYHFKIDGSPDAWINRAAMVGIGLIIQLALVLTGGGIVIGISRAGFLAELKGSSIKSENLMTIMGNIVAFPQLIIGFAMIDIFSYNAYRVHLLPIWLFAVIILVIVTIAFFAFLSLYIIRTGRRSGQHEV